MQTRKLLLTELPTEQKIAIANSLDRKDSINLANTCTDLQTSLQPMLFLQHVAEGKQTQAEVLLELISDPALILHKGKVTDYSDRTFKNISPLQYAAWAYDMHMLKMLLAYVPADKRSEAYQQLQELDEKGTEHGLHYDYSKLIQPMTEYYSQRDDLWGNAEHIRILHQISAEQRRVPVHVANEYCHPTRHFISQEKFKENTLVRSLELFPLAGYPDPSADPVTVYWYPVSNRLRLCIREYLPKAWLVPEEFKPYRELMRDETLAVENLFQVRIEQYSELKDKRFSQIPYKTTYLPEENNSSQPKTIEDNKIVNNSNGHDHHDPIKAFHSLKIEEENYLSDSDENDSEPEMPLVDNRKKYRSQIMLFHASSPTSTMFKATEKSPLIEKKKAETTKTCISCNLI